MARPEDNSTVQGFIAWLQETRCYSVAGPASDSRRAFVPVKAVETYLEENRNARLNSILAAVYYPKEPPTYAEAILKRYTAVFCILLEIGKGDCIHNFTEHESLRDAQLPFDPSDPPAHFLTAFEDAAPATYEQFCNKQWKYAVPILHRSLNQRFSVDRILPIVSKEPIKKSLDVSIFRIRIHEDYNFLRPWKSRFDDSPDTNLFALKTFRAREDYDDEVAAFKNIKHDQGVIGFCGTYVQDNAFNVIFEYADRGTLDEYFQQVHPPTTQQDTIKFWRELFAIIRGLGATYKAAHDPALPRSMSACCWHLDVEPSKILVASQNTANPYEVRFLLTGLCTNQFAGLRSGGTCPSAVNSYGAPEYSKIVPGAKLHDFHPKQSADIWSLGCVFSEAATWIVSGYEGTQRYRRKRKDEVDMRGRFASRPYFHDGLGILDTVQDHHRLLLDMLRSQDDISRSVVSLMIEEMLEVPEGRPNADQLWYKAQRILSKAEDQCAASTDNKSERSQSTVVFRSPAQIFSPIKDEVEAANVTTPIPFEDPDQQESSINLVAVKSSCLTRENDVSQTLPGSQSEIETCRECNNIQDFRGYIEEPKYVSGTESFSSTNSSTTVSSHADSDTSSGLGSRQQNEPLPELSISISAEVSKTLETSLQTTDFKIQPRKNSIQLPTEIISSHPSNVPYCSVADALVWKSKNKQRHQNSKVMPGPLLYRLGKREHIFLIDDAVSMRHHTKEVRNVLEALSYMIKEDNPEGIHLYFTNSTEHCESKHTKKLLAMLDRARYQGQTRILDSLLRIKYDHVSRVDGGASTKALTFSRAMSPQRTQRNIPLTVYILTDGAWIENASPEETIKMINEIFELRDRSPPLALQFISFEGNKACEERLRLLTLELSKSSSIRVVKSTGSVWDMLSGFVSSEVKNESGSMFRRLRTIRRSFSIKSTNSDNRTEPRGFEENFAIYHAGHGLAVWNSAESPTVDIVFIHGLDGGREKSWSFQPVNTINGLCWPKHLLTQNLPKARVLSYGYDSAPWRSYPIEDVISMQATELLTMLCAQRDESTRRPLIFVALDTGGLILKSALLQSHLSMDPNAKSMNAIKVSTTGILLLDPPEIQVSGNIAIPELLKPSDAAGSGCDPRMVTAQDLAWLKLQLDSFQSISECFSLYYVHKSAHQAKVPVQSVDILNQYGVNSNTESKAVPEQPSKDLISTAGEPNRPSTFRSHVSFRVERVYGFHDAIDPDYKKVEDAIFCLYNEGAEKCRQNWMLYLHDQETSAVESKDVYDTSDPLRVFPARNQQFTGRHADLDGMYSNIFDNDSQASPVLYPKVVELYGLGGVGKTQLALEFIHRYKHKFTSILWIDSQSRDSTQKSFSRIERKLLRMRSRHATEAQAWKPNMKGSSESSSSSDSSHTSIPLGSDAKIPGLSSCSIDIVKGFLAKKHNERWLIVFDGADDKKKSSWLPEFIPNTKHGSVIVTSRHRDLPKSSSGIAVEPMLEEEAAKLLSASCTFEDQNSAIELVRRLDRLPLAIMQAGAYMESTGMTASEYLNRFKNAKLRLWDDYASLMRVVFSKSVDEVLEKSYREVEAKDRDALELLHLCSFMAPENIPAVVLKEGSNKSGIRLDDMVDTLFNNGFGHREENLQSFRMHTLVQSWIRKRATGSDEPKAVELVRKALSTLATVVDSARRDPEILQGLEKLLLPHILQSLSRIDSLRQVGSDGCRDVGWAVLGEVCKSHERYSEAVRIYKLALSDPQIDTKTQPSNRQKLRFELGSLYQIQGNLNNAVIEYENVLGECENDPPGEANTNTRGQLLLDVYKALSQLYTRIGSITKSARIIDQGISKLEALFGPRSFQILQLLDVCASEFYEQENFPQAEKLYYRIVASQKQILGTHHHGTLQAQDRLAEVYFETGKCHEAELLCHASLASSRKVMGTEHPATLQKVVFLGKIYNKLSEYSKAEDCFTLAIEGYERVLGLQHQSTLDAREELAMCYEAQDTDEKLKQAVGVFEQVMFGREDTGGPKLRDTIRRLYPLLEKLGRHDEAKDLQAQWANGTKVA